MNEHKWKVAGLSRPDAEWFRDLARWSTAASIPVDFIKCVSVAEIQARLDAGEIFSAVVVGVETAELTRDFVSEMIASGAPVFLVASTKNGAEVDWSQLGISAVLPPDFRRTDLIDALNIHATPLTQQPGPRLRTWTGPTTQGQLVAVTGSGGTGVSVLSAALTQQLAAQRVTALLADLALNASQSVIHDTRDVLRGMQDLAEACRGGWLDQDELGSYLFCPQGRGYHLLCGLRRRRDWAGISDRSMRVMLEGLCRSYQLLVAEVEPDVSTADAAAGTAIESTHIARAVIERSDAVVVVGVPSMLGVHAMVRILSELTRMSVPASRIIPVLNRMQRRFGDRREVAAALSNLLADTAGADIRDIVFVDESPYLEAALRDGVALPARLGARTAKAVVEALPNQHMPNQNLPSRHWPNKYSEVST